MFASLDFLQVVEGMFGKCDITKFQQFVGVAQQILLWRNEVVHGGLFSHVFKQALTAMEEFQKVLAGVTREGIPTGVCLAKDS